MACEGCNSELKANNEKKEIVFRQAQELANKTGEWIGIYTDEQGKEQYRIVQPGYPFKAVVSPKLQNA